MKTAIKKAFPTTIPVLLGYVPLGIAFGLMMVNAGYNVLWTIISSVTIFSGTGQFVETSFLQFQTAIYEVAVIIIILNSRMMFYGLSFLDRYREMGLRKWYLMFALTDETYALLCVQDTPEGVKQSDYMVAISFLNHIYWIVGGIIGAVAGSLITFDISGIDYIMTTLFVVLAINQWKAYKSHEPFFIGVIASITSLLIFGADNFMIPALIIITILLIIRRRPIERKNAV